MSNGLAYARYVPFYCGQFFASIASGVAVSIGLLLADFVSGSPVVATLLRASTWVSAAVFCKVLSEIAALRGRKIACQIGWSIAVLGSLLVSLGALYNSIMVVLLGQVMSGASGASVLQSRFALSSSVPIKYIPRSLAIMSIVNAIGICIGPLISYLSPVIGDTFSANIYASSYFIATIILCMGLVSVFLWPSHCSVIEERTTTRKPNKTQFTIKQIASYWILAQFIMMGYMTAVPLYLRDSMSTNTINVVISIHLVGMYAFSPLAAWLYNKNIFKALIRYMAVALALCFVVSFIIDGFAIVSLLFVGIYWSFVQISSSSELSHSGDKDAIKLQGNVDMISSISCVGSIIIAGLFEEYVSFSLLNVAYSIVIIITLIIVGKK